MTLGELLTPALAQGWVTQDVTVDDQLAIDRLRLDSRAVHEGDVFIAVPGLQQDGRDYIGAALSQGAVAVLAEADGLAQQAPDAPVIAIDGLHHRLGELAAHFYARPSEQLEVIGITGTNGKTSCSQFIAQALTQSESDQPGRLAGVIGTLGYGLAGQMTETEHTTPDPIAVQSALSNLLDVGAQVVAMEVSSHALDQGRVNGVAFDTAVFTNLSRDHLDYHGDMAAYGAAKQKLFMLPGLKQAILNVDDDFGRSLAEQLADSVSCYRYSAEGETSAEVRALNVELSAAGIRADIESPWGTGQLTSRLLGRFNLSNLLAVYATLCVHGMSHAEALAAIAKLDTVAGRMQTLGGAGQPQVLVDFAHTPDALARVLRTARELTSGQLHCLFGCGGNRDTGKRALMGEAAAALADQLTITSDNPRDEDPHDIVNQIVEGISGPVAMQVIVEREEAIRAAIFNANADDLIVVAGKGHESYQEIQGQRRPFSDVEQVIAALANWRDAHSQDAYSQDSQDNQDSQDGEHG